MGATAAATTQAAIAPISGPRSASPSRMDSGSTTAMMTRGATPIAGSPAISAPITEVRAPLAEIRLAIDAGSP